MLTIIIEGACGNGITKLKSTNSINNNLRRFCPKTNKKNLRPAGEQGLKTPLLIQLHKCFTKKAGRNRCYSNL